METIKNYLDNMFAGISKTSEIMKMKEDLLANMEDKYNELKVLGKSENEAIGIVISEFGNIEELMREFDIPVSVSQAESLPLISEEECHIILHVKKFYGNLIAFGVWLCIMAPAVLILVSGFMDLKLQNSGFQMTKSGLADSLGLFPFLLMIAIAVGLFIFSGTQIEKYDYLKEPFQLDYHAADYIKHKQEAYQTLYTIQIVVGVMLCILSPLLLIAFSTFEEDKYSAIGLFLLLSLVAIAVFLFIHSGSIMDSYKELLQEKEFSKKSKKSNKLVDTAASIVWPITGAIYLLLSFLTMKWHITWIVFPVVGIIFGAFAAVVNAVTGTEV